MANCIPSRDVFIVHGHDNGADDAVALFIKGLGLRAIILHEESDTGKTIIEKVERYADVGFAVVILTPDDMGSSKTLRSKSRSPKSPSRARRNIVLDLCYFLGRLGHSRVYVLLKGRIEIPPEIADVPYTTMDDSGHWQSKLAEALGAAGMKLDTNV